LEIEDAIHTALLTLREGFEGEVGGWIDVMRSLDKIR
jgi:hypothetical protein